MSTLDLRENNLSGGIPNWIVRVQDLRALLLGGNHLEGQIPEQLCQLSEISFLDLSRNNFTGNVPACFYKVPFGKRNKRVSEYDMTLLLSEYYWYNHFHLLLFFEQNQYFVTAVAGGVGVEFRTKDSFLQYKGRNRYRPRWWKTVSFSGNILLSSCLKDGDPQRSVVDLDEEPMVKKYALNLNCFLCPYSPFFDRVRYEVHTICEDLRIFEVWILDMKRVCEEKKPFGIVTVVLFKYIALSFSPYSGYKDATRTAFEVFFIGDVTELCISNSGSSLCL
ncbi:receptor-like protein 15 [Senna tora]|uniref:Receptor-like protein 15 n=1 Tax=Senna tora TaxID=362788 RepID=A0A834T3G4_9FABA|nr:receptor-like protein 15 [Senna tora]